MSHPLGTIGICPPRNFTAHHHGVAARSRGQSGLSGSAPGSILILAVSEVTLELRTVEDTFPFVSL